MFHNMVDILTGSEEHIRRHITTEEYQEFERHWVLYILQEKRYGQAFCEHFDLMASTPLYHFKDEEICRRWIRDNYLV